MKTYQFQGQSARLTRQFNLDNQWSEGKFYTREPDFYKLIYKINTEGQEMETYQIFVVLMGNTKITEELDLQTCNDSVTPNINGKKQGMIWMMKKLLRIQNHQVIIQKKRMRIQ